MSQSIKKNFFYNILLNVTSVIFPLITAPYVSRILEPEGVGLFNFSHTYAGYFAMVALLGIPTYGVREVSKVREDKELLRQLVSELISIITISTFLVSIVYILTLIIVGQLTENFVIFLTAGFVIYFSPLAVNWFFQGLENFKYITFLSIIVKTINLVCLFVFVREKNDLINYVILSVLGIVITNSCYYLVMCKCGVKPYFTIKNLKHHIKPILILFASSVAISIYTVLDTLMLGFISDYEEVGYYTNAMYMTKALLYALTSLAIVAVPRVAYYVKKREYDKINDLMNKSFSVIAFLTFPCAVGLMCIAPVFIPLFFGVHFLGSVIPLTILSLLVIIIGFNNLTGTQILIGMGYDKFFLYSVIAGTISNFTMNSIMIPLWGGIGASIASVFAETLVLLVSLYFVYKYTPIRFSLWKDILKALSGSILLVPLFILLRTILTGWSLIVLFVLLGGITFLFAEKVLKSKSFEMYESTIISFVDNFKRKFK